ncbi:MAG: DUF1080 domain-containing protein [Verrucomicrobiota bacterium]
MKKIFDPDMRITIALLALFGASIMAPAEELEIPEALMGDWSLTLTSGEPTWMSVYEEDGKAMVRMRVYVGPEGPYEIASVEGDTIRFALKPKRVRKGSDEWIDQEVTAGMVDGVLSGQLVRTPRDGSEGEVIDFTGKRIPPMPTSPPDLSKVRFGQPVSLFNGKDLTGWRPYEKDKINGWSVEDGLLVNSTPKTDFSATGDHANLRTEAVFEDFWLHIEFLIEADRNSGVYLRGMYEAQVVDRDSRMQGLQGVGAIFSRIAPAVNAGRPPGEWQTYDITLVDRHVTVILNGVKVIDNEPVAGPTGGAINTDPMAPGPIYLQGDHTAVKYRDIYLAPVIPD